MNAQCSKCGTQLALPWIFCPHCGLPVTHETQATAPPAEHQKSSMPGAFGGLFFGVVMAPVLIIFGAMLCLTGLGAILGIPMIIAGLVSPLAGPLLGMNEHQGKCPCCGRHMVSVTDGQPHYCPACDKEFALIDHPMAKAG
jgi:predicted amidophosphoribosyltransferase